jgi:HEPN domain
MIRSSTAPGEADTSRRTTTSVGSSAARQRASGRQLVTRAAAWYQLSGHVALSDDETPFRIGCGKPRRIWCTARRGREAKQYEWACFAAHQSAEKALQTLIEYLGDDGTCSP